MFIVYSKKQSVPYAQERYSSTLYFLVYKTPVRFSFLQWRDIDINVRICDCLSKEPIPSQLFFLSFKTKFAVLDYKSLDKFVFKEWLNIISKTVYDYEAMPLKGEMTPLTSQFT